MKKRIRLRTAGIFLVLALSGAVRPVSAIDAPQASLGWKSYLELSAKEEAVSQWKQALRSNPTEPLSRLGLAVVSETDGDMAGAIQHYRAALVGAGLLLSERTLRVEGDRFFYEMLAGYALSKVFYLRDFRKERNLFTADGLERMEREGVQPALGARYRYYFARQTLEQGNTREAEKILAPLRFADSFLISGPFTNREESGLSERFPPEVSFDPDGRYRGKAREVGWRLLARAGAWGFLDLGTVTDPSRDATVYALTAVYGNVPEKGSLRIGHAGALKVWVNGECLLIRDAYHAALPDQVEIPLEIKRGWNPVLLKVCSKDGPFGTYLRFEGDPESYRWWDGSGDFPVAAGMEFQPDGPVWQSPRADVLQRIAEMEPYRRALMQIFYASGRRALQNLDENDHEDLESYRAAVEIFPKSSLIWRYRGIAEVGKNPARLAFEKSIALSPGNVLARQFLAEDYLRSKTPILAGEPIEEALAINPKAPAVWRLLGEYQREMGAEPLCHASFRRAWELAPYSSDYRETWIETRKRVMTTEELASEYRDALTAFPADRSLRVALIDRVLEMGHPSEAEALIREGLRVDPFDTDLSLFAIDHYRAAGNLERAVMLAAEGLKICPDDARFNKVMGLIRSEQGEAEEARKYWTASLTTRPQDTWLQEYMDYHSPEEGDYYRPYRFRAAELEEARNVSPAANSVVLLDQLVRKVFENGSSSHTVHRVIRILTDAGSRDYQREHVYYEPGREKVKIKRARVTRRDGTYFDAPEPRGYSAVQGGGEGSRVFGDYYVKVIDLPGVEKGVTIDLEYEIEETSDNIYSDYFGEVFYVGAYDPTALSDYVLITPSSRDVYYKVSGAEERPETSLSDDGKERVYRWTYRDLPLVKREPGMPSQSELLPYIKVSTFESWDSMARWYWDLIEDQFTMTAETRARAREVLAAYVQDRKMENPQFSEEMLTDLDKVKAVNRFVNTEVRYLGLEFGISGYRPHRVSEICSSQYGDCKDKATLAVAFLGELGVPGRIALLRTRSRGRIDYSLASLGLFNHAIVYLPDVDGIPFILDGTAQFYGTEELPAMDQGIDLLVIGEGGRWEFVESPLDAPQENGGIYKTELSLDADGNAEGLRSIEFEGLYNVSVRYAYENEAKAKDHLEQSLGGKYPGTTVSDIELSDLADPENDEWFRFRLAIPRFAEPAGKNLAFRPVLFPYEASENHAVLDRREHDLVIQDAPWHREREITVRIPEGYAVDSLPPPVQKDTPFGGVRTESSESEGAVTFRLRIDWNTTRVAAGDYPAFRQFCRDLDEAEDARIVLRRESE